MYPALYQIRGILRETCWKQWISSQWILQYSEKCSVWLR